MASSRAMVRAYVESLVEQLAGVEKVITDDDGDLPVRVGKTLFYVSIVGGDDAVVQESSRSRFKRSPRATNSSPR